MTVRIRLARFGRKVQRDVALSIAGRVPQSPCPPQILDRDPNTTQALPFYRIFIADARAPRDGRHIEIVGHYDPVPGKDGNKALGLNVDRVKYWLAVGAQPSATVGRLLGQAGVMPIPPPRQSIQTQLRGIKNPDKGKKR